MKNSRENTFMKERKINMWHTILLNTVFIKKNGHWRADYIRKHNIFHEFGEKCYYHPRKIPADAYMISIGNNVCIAADVKFVTHDVFSIMLNNCDKYTNLLEENKAFSVNYGTIKINDNVCIGEGVHIMPGVEIGNDSIIAGGSVVTKDVEEGTIVGGNPAKVIGNTLELAKRRVNAHDIKWNEKRKDTEDFYWK